jgi:glycine/D-amino acid oxidase-like deaminating enzyme
VQRLEIASGQIRGVELGNGRRISAPNVINAAGPWCNHLFTEANVEIGWPLQPTRIQVVHLDRPAELQGNIPVCVDRVAGIYFRLQNRGQQLIVSSVSEEDEQETIGDPEDYARYIDDDFARIKLYALEHRLRSLSIRGLNGYSGLYTINRSDMHPIVGPTEVEGLYAANGCSGHGFKLAPALGALLARLITGGGTPFDTDVDLRFLAVDRDPIQLESKSVLA